jgi:hypothetical protein
MHYIHRYLESNGRIIYYLIEPFPHEQNHSTQNRMDENIEGKFLQSMILFEDAGLQSSDYYKVLSFNKFKIN